MISLAGMYELELPTAAFGWTCRHIASLGSCGGGAVVWWGGRGQKPTLFELVFENTTALNTWYSNVMGGGAIPGSFCHLGDSCQAQAKLELGHRHWWWLNTVHSLSLKRFYLPWKHNLGSHPFLQDSVNCSSTIKSFVPCRKMSDDGTIIQTMKSWHTRQLLMKTLVHTFA